MLNCFVRIRLFVTLWIIACQVPLSMEFSRHSCVCLPSVCLLWINSTFKWVYISFSPLLFASLLFTFSCKASSTAILPFWYLFLWMVLISVSWTMSWTSVYSSSSTLSDLIPWMCFSLPLYNHKGFNLSHTWMVLWFSPFS